jgi:hypothetical protein
MEIDNKPGRSYLGLPLEIFLNVLDQLVGYPDGRQCIFDSSSPITKTLRALTLVSHTIYPVASRYLYSRCLYISTCTSYACLGRTLGLDLGNHPHSLTYGQAGRNEKLWSDANIPRYITSIFISPMKTDNDPSTPMVHLSEITDLCATIGSTLKRLLLDLQPVHTPLSSLHSHTTSTTLFLHLPNLEDLIASYSVLDFFPHPPRALKRLAITTQDLHDVALRFFFSTSSLQTLIMLRPPALSARDIDVLFAAYKGKSLDVVFVDVNSNHRTPEGTRRWDGQVDTVRVWEVDVPTSFYGDEDVVVLCEEWVWSRAVAGTLWGRGGWRRMLDWGEVERRLRGPVHWVVGG